MIHLILLILGSLDALCIGYILGKDKNKNRRKGSLEQEILDIWNKKIEKEISRSDNPLVQ